MIRKKTGENKNLKFCLGGYLNLLELNVFRAAYRGLSSYSNLAKFRAIFCLWNEWPLSCKFTYAYPFIRMGTFDSDSLVRVLDKFSVICWITIRIIML